MPDKLVGDGSSPVARDGETEARILEAAHRVFTRRGTAGARMQEIAAEAGVNHALLHYYFRSKDRLAEAVFRRAAGGLFPQVFAALLGDLTLEEKVRRIVALELDVLSRHPYLPIYVLSELAHHPERAEQFAAVIHGGAGPLVVVPAFERLAAQIDEGVRAGTMRLIRPEQFLVNLFALVVFPFAARPMLKAVMGMHDDAFGAFIAVRREELADFFLAGLRP